jgi:hypothetical protein
MWERYNHRKMYTKNGHSVGAEKKELYICNSVISGSVVTRVYCIMEKVDGNRKSK